MPFNITNTEQNSLVRSSAYDISSFNNLIQDNLSNALMALLTSEVVNAELIKYVDNIASTLSSYLPSAASSATKTGLKNSTIEKIKHLQELAKQIEKTNITIKEEQAIELTKRVHEIEKSHKGQRLEAKEQRAIEKAGQERNLLQKKAEQDLSYLEKQNIFAKINVESLIKEGKASAALQEIARYSNDFSGLRALSQNACHQIKTEALGSLAIDALIALQKDGTLGEFVKATKPEILQEILEIAASKNLDRNENFVDKPINQDVSSQHNIGKRADYDEYQSSTSIPSTSTTIPTITGVTSAPTQVSTTTATSTAQDGTTLTNTTSSMIINHANTTIPATLTTIDYSSTSSGNFTGNITMDYVDNRSHSAKLEPWEIALISLGGAASIILVSAIAVHAHKKSTAKVHPIEESIIVPQEVVVIPPPATPTNAPSLTRRIFEAASSLLPSAKTSDTENKGHII